eukprot:jgi/Ulvmu1/297/UM001_0301.1
MEPAARKACVMQLAPAAIADVCTAVHNLLARPERALAGGTQQAEIDLLATVAADIIPATQDWFLSLVTARCLHTLGTWPRCQSKVLELAMQPAVMQALKHGGIAGAYSTNTYAIMFLAGLLPAYRPLAEDWGRIRRIVEDVCTEATEMTKMVPLVAAPVKGPLFDFRELDVDMVPATPAAAALQHLALSVTQPAWHADGDRPSMLDPTPPKPRQSFHAALEAMEAAPVDMRDGLLAKGLVNVQRMDTVAFSVGGSLFHAVALSCEQNSPVMRAKLEKVSNIYKQVIPMRNVGNLDDTSMYEAFTLACEFMYTAEIDELEDAEVAINVWMVASALSIRNLPAYAHGKAMQLLPAAHLHLLPGLFRQAHAAWQLSRSAKLDMEEQGATILHAVVELMMCKMQDLVKKKVLHKVVEEHGSLFQDRLAATIGIMLGMEPEPPPPRDSVVIFKFVAADEGSVDFWRQLAAGMVIGRYVKPWLARKRGERVLRAEAERQSAIADPMQRDVQASLLTTLPGTGGHAAKQKRRGGKGRATREVITEEEDEEREEGEDGGDEAAVETEAQAEDVAEEELESAAVEEEDKKAEKKKSKKKDKDKKRREDEGVAYLGAETPKKDKKSRDRKKRNAEDAPVEDEKEMENKGKGKGTKAAAGVAADEQVRPGSSAGGLDSADMKVNKKEKKSKKAKDEGKSKRATITCADEEELLIKEELRR